MGVLFARMFSKQMVPASKDWNEATEARISKTAAVLSNVKVIKMIGLESLMKTVLKTSRETEIQRSIAVRKIEINKIGTCM